jgi:hypothetical protein
MKIGPFTFTRESAIWWVGLAAAIITGLATLDAKTAVETFGIPLAWLPRLRLASLIIGIGSAWAKTSPFPSKDDASKIIRVLLLAIALGGAAVSLPACAAKTAPALTPSQKAAAILQRVDELQNAVISANTLTPGSIPDAVAVPLVRFCVETAKVLRASPDGVLPAIAAEWQSVKLQVPQRYRQLPAVAAAFIAVDIAFAEFGAPPEKDPLGARIAQHLHYIGFAMAAVGAVAVCAFTGGCWGN